MKLLLEGSLMALVLISELVGLVALAKDRASTEVHLPAHRGFTIVSAPGGDGDYQLVEWDGTSCGVWEVQREVDARANSFGGEGGGVDGEEGDCRRVHVRAHMATTRQAGVVRPTGWPRPERTTSENSTSGHFGE
jgi:hypothetical protein